VQLRAGLHPTVDELARWCCLALEACKCPRHWWRWTREWPQTRSGKTDHAAIARLLLADGPGGLQPWR